MIWGGEIVQYLSRNSLNHKPTENQKKHLLLVLSLAKHYHPTPGWVRPYITWSPARMCHDATHSSNLSTQSDWWKQKKTRTANALSESMLKDMSERMSEDMSDRVSQDLSERMSKEMAEDMSQRMSEDISEDMSERMSKDMSERTSEDCFQSVGKVEGNGTHFGR